MSTLIQITKPTELIVNNTPITGGVAGRVLFQGTGNVLQQSANLFWDETNGRLGIGTSTPISPLHIIYAENTQSGIALRGTNGGGGVFSNIDWLHTGNSAILARIGVNQQSGEFRLTAGAGGYFQTFYSNNAERMRIPITGNVLINTTTDAGFLLDVNGTGRFQNTLKFSNSITASTQNGYFEGNSAGNITNTTAVFNFQYPTISTSGTMFQFSDNLNTGFVSDLYGNKDIVRIFGGFKNPNGAYNYSDLKIDPTYQGDAASSIIRGIYYKPTNSLTGTYTHRAIDLTSGDFVWGTGYSQYYGNSIEGFIQFNTSGSTTQLWMRPPNNPNNYGTPYYSKISHTNADLTINSGQYGSLYLGANGGSGANTSMVLYNAAANTPAYVLINTTTNAGFRLDVNGTARVSGSELRVGNLQLLTSGSPGATGQGITTTGRKISLQSQGEINIDNAAAYQFLGYADSPVAMTQNATGRTVSFVQVKGGFSSPNYNNTQGNLLWINPVYNMGGTTNAGQILRGIYYNPTLTDLTNATHYAIHTTSGRIRFEGLPTSSAGLSAGEIWNDGGTIRIV